MEGSRPLLMEVQALCSPLPQGVGHPPVRMPSGVNKNRLYLLLAVSPMLCSWPVGKATQLELLPTLRATVCCSCSDSWRFELAGVG